MAKKAKAKKTTKTSVPQNILITSNSVFKMLENKNKMFIGLTVLVAIVALVYFNLGLFIAATVNGVPISRLTILKELENQGGAQVLESIITQELIKQEAAKASVTVTEDELNSKISEIEEQLKGQGMDLETALSYQGQTIDDLKKNIEIQVTLEKLLMGNEQIGDDEAMTYFEENKTIYGDDAKFEDVKNSIISQLKSQKLSEKYQAFITEKQAGASINKFVNY